VSSGPEELEGTEEQPPDGEEQGTEDEPDEAAPQQRSQRRRLEKAKREELARFDFFQDHDPDEPYNVVLRGEGIGRDAGSAVKIGAAIMRVARLLQDLVPGDVQMQALAFGNSVRIELRPSKAEQARAGEALERARRLRREADTALREPDEEAIKEILKSALTNVQVATALAADLFETTAGEAPEHAVRLGTAVAQTYKSLANTIVREKVTVAMDAPERAEPAQLSPNKAERVVDALRAVTAPTKVIEIVVGTLSIADATQKTFGLAFDPGARKPEIFRKRRLIRGPYTPEVEEKIIERGLWGRRVRATIEVERDTLVSTSTIRPPAFRLLDVEEAVT
jgi:hypothetical protein